MSKYTDLITNYHRGKANFVSHIDLSTRPFTDITHLQNNFFAAFDIDNATGAQLDVLGEWIGRSRAVTSPIAGVYFCFDTDNLGYDQGVWQGPYDPDAGKMSLSDDTFRAVLKTKIAINQWDGQNETLPAILNNAVSGSGIRMQIVDNQDMTISIWVSAEPEYNSNATDREVFDNAINGTGAIKLPDDYTPTNYTIGPFDNVSRELMAIIRAGYLTVKAGGVFSGNISTPSDGYQFFGFDVDNEYIAGFDAGAWGVDF